MQTHLPTTLPKEPRARARSQGDSQPLMELVNLSKSFGAVTAVDRISLSLQEGEIACLLGPSGCGKTTLLRLIAGLEKADSGAILFQGRDIAATPIHQRNFGFMFQDYALFPHKNIAENVAFGLRMAKQDRQAIAHRVHEVLELVGLADKSQQDVSFLSGGEQQRVALARSLAPSPRLLLLDEPLGSLDRALRERLMNELRTILKQIGLTAITVTHDQQEAFALADKIVVMEAGRALQMGSPEEVYRQPASPTVARFLGLANILAGKVVQVEPFLVQTAIGRLSLPKTPENHPLGALVDVLLRPEAVASCANGDSILLTGILTSRSFRGGHYQIEIKHPAGPHLTFTLSAVSDGLPDIGEPVQLYLDPGAISLLPPHETA